MPNQVTSHNDRTLFKAARALASHGKMTFEEALDAIDRLMDAGLLIREPAEKEEPKKVEGNKESKKPLRLAADENKEDAGDTAAN